jgi:hypothetical protein
MIRLVLAAVAFTVVIAAMALQALSTPDVEFSYSSKQCMAVINTDNRDYSCNNLPSKYNRIWVK